MLSILYIDIAVLQEQLDQVLLASKNGLIIILFCMFLYIYTLCAVSLVHKVTQPTTYSYQCVRMQTDRNTCNCLCVLRN